ncbi:M48 family metallopeptidase, partial [uncultured Veillonella sp.]
AYIEYVMVHEFAHFKYLDHSKNFHNLVAQFLPDWKVRKKSLNVYFAHRP